MKLVTMRGGEMCVSRKCTKVADWLALQMAISPCSAMLEQLAEAIRVDHSPGRGVRVMSGSPDTGHHQYLTAYTQA